MARVGRRLHIIGFLCVVSLLVFVTDGTVGVLASWASDVLEGRWIDGPSPGEELLHEVLLVALLLLATDLAQVVPEVASILRAYDLFLRLQSSQVTHTHTIDLSDLRAIFRRSVPNQRFLLVLNENRFAGLWASLFKQRFLTDSTP